MRPRRRAGLVLALTTVLVAAVAAPAALAAWTLSLSAAVQVGVATVAGTVQLTPITAEFRNDQFQVTTLATVSNTTVTTSAQSLTVVASFAATATTGLAAKTRVAGWPVATSGACAQTTAVPGTAEKGWWSTGITMPSVTLATSGAQMYCLRSWVDGSADSPSGTQNRAAAAGNAGVASGTQNFVRRATATLAIHNFTRTVTATDTLATSAIYPYSATASSTYYKARTQDECVDMASGESAPAGSPIEFYECHSSTQAPYRNQLFRMQVVGGETGQVAIQAQVPNRYLQSNATAPRVTAAGTTVGSGLNQRWLPQLVSANTYQIVAADTGLCWTWNEDDFDMLLQTCTGDSYQLFTWTLT